MTCTQNTLPSVLTLSLVTRFENFRRIDLYPVWERLAGNAIPNWIKVFQTAALIGLAGLAVSKTRHQRSDDARLLSNLMIMLTSLIAIYHSNYDGLLLFWPLVIWFGGEKLVNTSSRQKNDYVRFACKRHDQRVLTVPFFESRWS